MFYARPLLFSALSCLLGICSTAAEVPGWLRIFFLLSYFLLLFHCFHHSPYRSSRTRLYGMLLLSCLCFCGSAGRYLYLRSRLLSQERRTQFFLQKKIRVSGRLSSVSFSEKTIALTLDHALLSSAFGHFQELSPEMQEKKRSFYDIPIGSCLIYLKAEEIPVPAEKLCEASDSRTEQGTAGSLIEGQQLELLGKLLPEEPPQNLGSFDTILYRRTRGLSCTIYADSLEGIHGRGRPPFRFLSPLKRSLASVFDALCQPEYAGAYRAMLLGEKSAISQELKTLFQDSGIAHILAISGLHLAILGGTIYRLLLLLSLDHRFSSALAALTALLFALLSGSSQTVLRALLMLCSYLFSRPLGRTHDSLSALSLALMSLLLPNPYRLFSVSFQLSFLAMLSISLYPFFQKKLLPSPRLSPQGVSPCRVFLSYLGMPFCLQLFLLPAALFYFFKLPVYAVLLNLLVLPLFPFLLYTAILALPFYALYLLCEAAPLLLLSRLLIRSSEALLQLYESASLFSRHLPLSVLLPGKPPLPLLVFYGISLSLPLIIPRRKPVSRILLLPFFCTLFLLLHPLPEPGLSIAALSVGQGDGFVIRYRQRTITVDNGSSSDTHFGEKVFLPYLLASGIREIDCAVLTHSDIDHISGIVYLLANPTEVSIRQLLLPASALHDARYDELRALARAGGCSLSYLCAGDTIRFSSGDSSPVLLCLYPEDGHLIEEANVHSTTLLLSYQNLRMLFTGDLPMEQEATVIKNAELYYPKIAASASQLSINNSAVPVTVLKCAHHGSRSSTGEEFLNAFPPDYAILSCGRINSYGHPHRETMERLREHKVFPIELSGCGETVLRTDGRRLRFDCPYQKRLSSYFADS